MSVQLPAFLRSGGTAQLARTALIADLDAAKAHFAEAGDAVEPDTPAEDGTRRWRLDHRGWRHGGLPDEGLIHIADEDARRRAANERRRAAAREND